ncbi:MAG: SCO4848 family membrane protein [Sporichthyaceae bacterium]
MKRGGMFLIGVAAWMVFTWSVFAKNMWFGDTADDESTGFLVVHSILIVTNMAVAAALFVFGRHLLKRAA